jgi:ArsR family transcriptional regulator
MAKDMQYVADLLKVIADENRLKILCCLLKNNEQCVCDIWQNLNIPQNLTSHHLKVLRDAGLLNSHKQGLKVIYSINKAEMVKFQSLLNNVLQNEKGNSQKGC